MHKFIKVKVSGDIFRIFEKFRGEDGLNKLRKTVKIMEQLSRIQLYKNLMGKNISQNFRNVLSINIDILSGIEELFLTTEEGRKSRDIDLYRVIDLTRQNLSFTMSNESPALFGKDIIRLYDNLSKEMSLYESKQNTNNAARKFFNKLLKELSQFNKMTIGEDIWTENREKTNKMPQVFLSHAYDDKAYALALFDFFYTNGIYLYVGWMHNGIIHDGEVLKQILQDELYQSNQLLFLRTINSELDIQGKQFLRPWCAWELGNYYNVKDGEEKYLINLYSIDEYNNIQTHGLRLFSGIVDQRMQGAKIRFIR